MTIPNGPLEARDAGICGQFAIIAESKSERVRLIEAKKKG